jgi:hypothetical protein
LGGQDAFLSKYDVTGNLLWVRQFGTSRNDYGDAVSIDGMGNVYVSGATEGSIGGPNAGGEDVFISKFDALGAVQWTKQIGTPDRDFVYAISVDGLGNVFLSGDTRGGLDGSNAGGIDAFLVKYDAAGNLNWTRQLGSPFDEAAGGASADGHGNVYISGYTRGSLGGPNAGGEDAFLAKYDAAGSMQWLKQLGTSGHENGRSVLADGLDGVYLIGTTFGDLGATNAGIRDAYLAKYDSTGSLQSILQLGTAADDWGVSISSDGRGNIYISGDTGGSLGAAFAGIQDAFLVKFTVPEPGTLASCALALVILTRCRIARSKRVPRRMKRKFQQSVAAATAPLEPAV